MPEGLQFEHAEFASGNHCTICQNNLNDTYYRLFQDTVCPSCAEKVKLDREAQVSRGGGLLKATLFGAGAAFAGAAIYGLVTVLSGYAFALIAILNGWMVGRAMMRGSGGMGGRRFQIVGVLLTYLSITTGYLPSIVKEIVKDQQVKEKTPAAAAPAKAEPNQPGGAAPVVIALAFLVGIAAIAPFLNLSSASGLIGLLIIFFGLQRAWRECAGVPFEIQGPFPFTPAA